MKTYKTNILGRRWHLLGLAGFLSALIFTQDFSTSLGFALLIDLGVILVDKFGWMGKELTVTLSSSGSLSFFLGEELWQYFVINECKFIANFYNPADPNSNVSDCMLTVMREGHPVTVIDCGRLGKKRFLQLLRDLNGVVKPDVPVS